MTTAGPWIEVSSGPTKKSRHSTVSTSGGRGDGDGAVGEGEDRGHLARGVGVRDGADRGAPVADRRVGDVRRRPGQQRLDPGGGVVLEQLVVPDERSHRHAVPGGLDGVEAGHPVDVHQRGRRREPHGEQREQRLATGEHLGALTLVREDREGLVEGAGVGVTEGSWFHRLSVPSPWLCRAARVLAPVDLVDATTGRASPRHRARGRTSTPRPGADPRAPAPPSSPPGPAPGRCASRRRRRSCRARCRRGRRCR